MPVDTRHGMTMAVPERAVPPILDEFPRTARRRKSVSALNRSVRSASNMDDLTILDLRQVAERLHATGHFVRTLNASDELKFVQVGKSSRQIRLRGSRNV